MLTSRPYSIEFTREAARALEKMPSDLRTLVLTKIERIATNPYAPHNNATRLRGRAEFRLRVQDWRVIYRIVDDRVVLLIIRIGTRGKVYE